MKYTIKSSLIGKEEAFKMIALSTCTKLPLLINGDMGTGKTQTVCDFANSLGNNQNFIIELNEGTKVSSLLGKPNMKKLFSEKTLVMDRPITKAETIIINEVDKADANIRNSLLSIMAEKKIFDGDEVIDCNWKTFVATSNEIPKGEEHLPFWDRFILKYQMPKSSKEDLLYFMNNRTNSKKEVLELEIPSLDEINNVNLDKEYLDKFVSLIYTNPSVNCSDRTVTKIDQIIKACSIVFDITIENAVLKVAELIAKPIMAELSKELLPLEISNYRSHLESFRNAISSSNVNLILINQSLLQIQECNMLISKNPKLLKYHQEYENLTKSLNEEYYVIKNKFEHKQVN